MTDKRFGDGMEIPPTGTSDWTMTIGETILLENTQPMKFVVETAGGTRIELTIPPRVELLFRRGADITTCQITLEQSDGLRPVS